MALSTSSPNASPRVHYIIAWKRLEELKWETTLGGEPLVLSPQILSRNEAQFSHECEGEIFFMAHKFWDPMQEVTYQSAKAKL